MERIQQMIDWIEANLTMDFSLEALAKEMNYSPYYCSFIFHQTVGISIRRYILLRRLGQSTSNLKNGERILDIALIYRYSSQEGYSRAFKKLFGITPKSYQKNPLPIQSTLKMDLNKEGDFMSSERSLQVQQLQAMNKTLFEMDVLNILNGQVMYDEFFEKKLMGNSDYIPFNEAMAVNKTSAIILDDHFITIRAKGHNTSNEAYREKVVAPLQTLVEKKYKAIVLWFGEDVFCQMNALTILAYLEQLNYTGTVFLNSFREDEFQVNQQVLQLGSYNDLYKQVLVAHQMVEKAPIPVLYQAIQLFIELKEENNRITKYIKQHPQLTSDALVRKLLQLFPEIGYGDTQYIEIIYTTRMKQG